MIRIIKKLFSGLRIVSFLFLLTFISCEYEKTETILTPENVFYNADVQPIFNAKCVSCHSGSIPPDLRSQNSYQSLTSGNYLDVDSPSNSPFYLKISGSGSMAQYANDWDRAIILRWIELGALNN